MPVVMLAIERSERASITTGKDMRNNVAEGDPLDGYGIGVASGDDMDTLRHRGCLPLHSLRSFHEQVPPVTQMTPSGCFAQINKCPSLIHLELCLPDNDNKCRHPVTGCRQVVNRTLFPNLLSLGDYSSVLGASSLFSLFSS